MFATAGRLFRDMPRHRRRCAAPVELTVLSVSWDDCAVTDLVTDAASGSDSGQGG